jgi:23S rRNA (cytidine1920-2'-O)/16S rRNA (cytidine1409-2'-O)-methyltransferase
VDRPPAKTRLDRLLVERGLASSLEKARALIYAGAVTVAGQPVTKPGKAVDPSGALAVKEPEHPYVSRGGVKLAHALDYYGIVVEGWTALDIGASTGGFTHCLLLRGALRVQAVDVGYGQLAWKLRQDERVTVIERANIRHLPEGALPEKVDLITIDVSFISLKIVIPAVIKFLKPDGLIVALIKPQFEIGKGRVGKGGVVRDPADHREVLADISAFAGEQGLDGRTPVVSPIIGPKGNVEFFNVFSLAFPEKIG